MEPRIQMLPGAIGILVGVLALSLHPAATDPHAVPHPIRATTVSSPPSTTSKTGTVPDSGPGSAGDCPRCEFAELVEANEFAADVRWLAGRTELAGLEWSKPTVKWGLSPSCLSPSCRPCTPSAPEHLFSGGWLGVGDAFLCCWSVVDLFFRSAGLRAGTAEELPNDLRGPAVALRSGRSVPGGSDHLPAVRSIIVVTSHDLSGAAHDFEIAFDCQPLSPVDGAEVGFLGTDHAQPMSDLTDVANPSRQARLNSAYGSSMRGSSGSVPAVDEPSTDQVDGLPGCQDLSRHSAYPPPTGPRLSPERRFVRPQFGDHGTINRPVMGTLICRGQRVAVYVDLASQTVEKRVDLSLVADRVLRVLGDDVLRHVEQELHPVADVDQDGSLSILITDLDCRSLQSDVPIRGVVRGSDFLDEQSTGHGDQLYLDWDLPESNGELRALLSHELSHAAIYSWQREQMLGRGLSPNEAQELLPGWLHEAMAHCVELDFEPESANFSDRRQAFLMAPANAPVVTNEQVVPFHVRRSGARAAATLFLKDFLGGETPLKVLLTAEKHPIERFEQISGTQFSEVIRRWGVQQAVRCLAAPQPDRNPEICGVLSADRSAATVRPEVVGIKGRTSAGQGFRLRRSVRGTASFFLSVDSVVTSASVVAEPSAGITVSSVTRMGDDVIVRLLSGPEVDSVAKTSPDHRKSIPEDSAVSLPKRPTPKRSDLRAEFEETTF